MRWLIALCAVFSLAPVGALAQDTSDTVLRAVHDCDRNDLKDLDRAIQACSLLLNVKPHPIRYFNRGALYLLRGDDDRAITDFNEAIRLNPRFTEAYAARAVYYHGKGEYDRALRDCDDAIRLGPRTRGLADAYKVRGFIYEWKDDYDRAISDYSDALRLNPSDVETYTSRGTAYRKKRDYSQAIADYSEAIRLDPINVAAYLYRGDFWEILGDRTKAIEDYNKVLALSPRTELDGRMQASARRRLAELHTVPTPLVKGQTTERQPFEGGQGIPGLSLPGSLTIGQPPPTTAGPAGAEPSGQPPPANVLPGRRVALVIGNSAYRAIEHLPNPTNDARAVAASLRRLGFAEVIERYDLSLTAMVEAFKAFGDKTADADWAIVYYAGHGIEMAGTTYLIPTDARLMRDAHVPDEALPLDRVLAKVETARKLRLVILDACRNNPFLVRMARVTGPGRSIGRGLARIEPDGGVIVAYAAKHGTIAQDGAGTHSPFTEALLAHLEEPGLEINFLFRKVRDRVLDRTGKVQEPFVYGSLGSEPLYFKAWGVQ